MKSHRRYLANLIIRGGTDSLIWGKEKPKRPVNNTTTCGVAFAGGLEEGRSNTLTVEKKISGRKGNQRKILVRIGDAQSCEKGFKEVP